jgi:hypothetical protein
MNDAAFPSFAAGMSDHFALISSGVAVPLLIAGFTALVLRRWGLALWPIVHVATYVALGLPYYHWYYYPVELVGVIAVLVGSEVCVRLALRFAPKLAGVQWTGVFLALVVGIAAIPSVRGPILLQPGPMLAALRSVAAPDAPEVDARFRAYQGIAGWIALQPEKTNATLLASEIGTLGHALPEVRVLDIVGLADPGVPSERFFDYRWHIERYEPEYLVLFLGAAQLDRHTVPLSDGRTLEYRRAFVPQSRFRGGALFERASRSRP